MRETNSANGRRAFSKVPFKLRSDNATKLATVYSRGIIVLPGNRRQTTVYQTRIMQRISMVRRARWDFIGLLFHFTIS